MGQLISAIKEHVVEEKKISDKKDVENVSFEIYPKKKQIVHLPIPFQTWIKSTITTIKYTWKIDRFLYLTRKKDMLRSPLFTQTEAEHQIQINVERTESPAIKFYLLATKAFNGSCTITLAFPRKPNLLVKSVWGPISGQTLLTEITKDFFNSIYREFAYTDTLTIRCELEILFKQIHIDTIHEKLQSSTMFSENMRSLEESTLDESDNELEDEKINFIIGDEKYVISKKLLHATNSSYFKNICLTHKGEEKDMTNELTNIELKTFQEMLVFIQTGSNKLSKSNYEDYNMLKNLLTTADKYDVPALKLTYEHYLLRYITVYNATEFIQFAFSSNAKFLETQSATFIKFHFKEVMNTKEFQNLPLENVTKIMELIEKCELFEMGRFPIAICLDILSSYFKNICLTHGGKEKNEITTDMLQAFLEMLYFIITGSIKSKDDYRKLKQLLIIADEYDVPILKLRSELYLVRKIMVCNAMELIQLAYRCNAEFLKIHLAVFIKSHKKEIYG